MLCTAHQLRAHHLHFSLGASSGHNSNDAHAGLLALSPKDE